MPGSLKQLLGTPKWSKILFLGTPKRRKIWLSGTPKWRKIWLSGTPKWSKISNLKKNFLNFLEAFQVIFLKPFPTNPNANLPYGPNIACRDTPLLLIKMFVEQPLAWPRSAKIVQVRIIQEANRQNTISSSGFIPSIFKYVKYLFVFVILMAIQFFFNRNGDQHSTSKPKWLILKKNIV